MRAVLLLAALLPLALAHSGSPGRSVHHRRAHRHQPFPRGAKHSTFGTYYQINHGDLGACGNSLSPDDFTVALAQPMYGSLNAQSQFCGQTITIYANGKSHTATIADACPTGNGNCGGSDLDMTQALFSYFSPLGAGKIPITWVFGDAEAAASKASAASAAASSKAAAASASEASAWRAHASSVSASKASVSSASEASAWRAHASSVRAAKAASSASAASALAAQSASQASAVSASRAQASAESASAASASAASASAASASSEAAAMAEKSEEATTVEPTSSTATASAPAPTSVASSVVNVPDAATTVAATTSAGNVDRLGVINNVFVQIANKAHST